LKRIGRAVCLLVGLALPDPARAEGSADTETRARALFEQGLDLARSERWDAALAAFLRSRELHRSRGNTQNAAIALARVGRSDEAFDLFSELLRDYPGLSSQDQALVQAELGKLAPLVGSIDVVSSDAGASVLIDGRARGKIPLSGSLRVAAGARIVRVVKTGSAPFETRVDVAGGETARVNVKLEALRRAGSLRVSESRNAPAQVFVDGGLVGDAPWEGRLSPGRHVVRLGGADRLGTDPVSVAVSENEQSRVALELVPVECHARIAPTPASASVALDGVELGRGVWQGALSCRLHRVEAREEGFVTIRRSVTLEALRQTSVEIELERDPSSPRWRVVEPPHLAFDLSVGAPLGVLGVTRPNGCDDACSAPLPLGAQASLGARYVLGSGLGFGLELAALRATADTKRVGTRIHDLSDGGSADARFDDDARLDGVQALAQVSFERGKDYWVFGRAGVGFAVAELDVARRGTTGSGEKIDARRSAVNAEFLALDARVGFTRRLGRHWRVGPALELCGWVALGKPRYDGDRGAPSAASLNGVPTRFVRYPADPLLGSVTLFVVPELTLGYSFL